MNELVSIGEANGLIDAGAKLHVAGDEAALRQLHRGTWIGGTSPYFITQQGGMVTREKVFVTALPEMATDISTRLIDIGHIPAIVTEAPHNGFSLVIAPAMSDIHITYGLTAGSIPGIHDTPVYGWIAGVHLDDLGRQKPKVFDGVSGTVSDNRIVVMDANLPLSKKAVVRTINLFQAGDGDRIVFEETDFSAGRCSINGEPDDFFDYATRQALDTKLPLITRRGEDAVNVAFQSIDHETRRVRFFAPVMKGLTYRQAQPLSDYREALIEAVKGITLTPAFICNCILNYLYGGLEGEQFIPMPGPATFGELAHILLNQTLVTLAIEDK